MIFEILHSTQWTGPYTYLISISEYSTVIPLKWCLQSCKVCAYVILMQWTCSWRLDHQPTHSPLSTSILIWIFFLLSTFKPPYYDSFIYCLISYSCIFPLGNIAHLLYIPTASTLHHILQLAGCGLSSQDSTLRGNSFSFFRSNFFSTWTVILCKQPVILPESFSPAALSTITLTSLLLIVHQHDSKHQDSK